MRRRRLAIQNKRCRFTANARDKRGFTLIEVMVTLIILALGMLASCVGIMAALDHSLMNEMRNDAMKISQEQLEAARNMPYANIALIPTPQYIARQVRKTLVTYKVEWTPYAVAQNQNPVTQLPDGMSLLQFKVSWSHKGPMDSAARWYYYYLQTIVRQTK